MTGYTGPAKRPRALVVRLPDGRIRLTRAISARLSAQVATQVAAAAGRTARPFCNPDTALQVIPE
ncbi:hypothetical protein [Streptomyces sp. GESEQ-35]|uniref:hypothetical protein n=1 Tax=Streptomyces sp. GESEQ-35 TaxID=2812657 RepID=UPI001B326E5F|nr:hypothetical protein [Streptomyces sp. GESEQ-35]